MKKIAVVGAHSGIGREILSFLADENFPAANVTALESRSVMGNMVSYGEEDELDVLSLDNFDFKGFDAVIFAAADEVSKKYAPHALSAGAKVVDCGKAFFGNPDVPMIIAGMNNDKLQAAVKGMASVPAAGVTQLLLPLQNVWKDFPVKRIVVSDYTATSVYGKEGMDELFNQTRRIFMNDTLADDQQVFHKQIAFNVIPHVGDFIGEETAEEWAYNAEIKQILGGDVKVHANCAVIPAFIGCAQYANIEFSAEVDVEEIRKRMSKTEGVVVFDKHVDGGYVTLNDVQGETSVYISRLRQDASVENGISFWCVADSLRAGVAKNALAVARLLTSCGK